MQLTSSEVKIVIASGVRGDTRRYRTFHLYEQCRRLDLNMVLSHVTDPHFQQQVDKSNLLVLHRAPWDDNIQRALDSIHRKGGWIIYDTDDLLFDLDAFKYIDSPDFADPVRAKLYQEDMTRHRRTMEACDAILTSTQYLADQAVKLGIRTFVHRNGFSAEMLALANKAINSPRPVNNRIVLGYASGTPTHNRDFESIGPAIQKTLDDYPGIFLWLIGPIKLNKTWGDYQSRITHLPHVPWRLLPAYLSRFDINLAPLEIENPFAQSKSEIKWMEAALVHVPTIASGTSTFRSAIQTGKDGLVASSLSEWQDSLHQLMGDSMQRQAMGNKAYNQVLQCYSPETRAGQFLAILEEVTGQGIPVKSDKRKSLFVKRIRRPMVGLITDVHRYEKSPTLIRMAFYSMRERGTIIVIKQAWVFFRRLISPLIPYSQARQ
jgi:glycosyltransferase involved in cell wall biosynthesis